MKELFVILLIFASARSSIAAPSYLDDQEFMTLENARNRWGEAPFQTDKFRKGSTKERAAMAVSLIESKRYIGKTTKQVREDLGPNTGHFWSNRVPSYFIEEGWQKRGDTWQLVFLLTDDGERIADVRVHKNCCKKEASK